MLFFFLLALIFDLLAIYFLCLCHKTEWKKTKWAAAIILLPYIGAFFFLCLGCQRHFEHAPQLSYQRIEGGAYAKELRRQYEKLSGTKQNHSELMLYNIKEGDALYQYAESIETFTSGRKKYESLKNDIENATKYIHFLYYIFENDTTGSEIARLLAKKARQGVEVKILYDSWGCHTQTAPMFAALRMAGCEILDFAPLRSSRHLRFNYREHRKIVVIDGKTGYIGGMNISNNYADLGRITPWRDTHLRLTGEIVHSLQMRFLMDWAYAGKSEYASKEEYFPAAGGDIPMQIVSSGPDKPQRPIRGGFMYMINNARKTLCISTGYFVPDKSMLMALKRAAHRGVDVELLLSEVSDHYELYAVAACYLPQLIEAGVKVYYYHGYVHAKSMIMDGEIVNIGTANLDMRSFFDNFEQTAIIYDKNIAELHMAFFASDIANSRQLSLDDLQKRPLKDKLVGNIMKLIAPML